MNSIDSKTLKDVILEPCRSCAGTLKDVKVYEIGDGQGYRVICEACEAEGGICRSPEGAAFVWNDAQLIIQNRQQYDNRAPIMPPQAAREHVHGGGAMTIIGLTLIAIAVFAILVS